MEHANHITMLQNYWRILTKCYLDTGSTLVLYDPFETDNTPLCDYRLELLHVCTVRRLIRRQEVRRSINASSYAVTFMLGVLLI